MVVSTTAQPADLALVELRNRFARNYLRPKAHFDLVKYFLQRGDHVQAFYITEYARRYRFAKKDFDSAHKAFFGDPMPEPPEEAKDAFAAGYRLIGEKRYDEAEQFLLKAAKIDPRSFYINAWIGRFYYKIRSDNARALSFYFNSYFAYPHAYETEYVESRIRSITLDDGAALYKSLRASGKPPTELSKDNNPVIVNLALAEMAESWKPEYLQAVIDCLGGDDSVNRWQAFRITRNFAGARFEEIVSGLLADPDLRKRGLALYVVIDLWKEKGYKVIAKMLTDRAEIIRFDAVSALVFAGGTKAIRMLRAQERKETNWRLKSLINDSLKRKTKEGPSGK